MPIPATVPGDFTVLLGAVISATTLRELEERLAALGVAGPLSLLEWIEVELRGFEELLEELYRLRGAVMAVAAPMVAICQRGVVGGEHVVFRGRRGGAAGHGRFYEV